MEIDEKPSPYAVFTLTLSIFALLMLAANTFAHLDSAASTILDYADSIVCGLFFIDFLILFYRAPNRKSYFFRWGWIDLLSSVPIIPALRMGRMFRIIRILRVLRGFRAAKILGKFILNHRSESALLAAILLTILLIVICSIGVLQFESSPDANIKTPEDALWWAICTIATVGYGDRYPVTSEGRIVASILMFAGLCLIGTISGFVASWFLKPSENKNDLEIKTLIDEVRELKSMYREALLIKEGSNKNSVLTQEWQRQASNQISRKDFVAETEEEN